MWRCGEEGLEIVCGTKTGLKAKMWIRGFVWKELQSKTKNERRSAVEVIERRAREVSTIEKFRLISGFVAIHGRSMLIQL
ncbi:hypothetical protein Syun_007078 [Stephania yunnanensis]|uniref:Uncharacterized protein n=1 Tax=Stephania yunnanensis TaxID=152371 RepID=A0AAP0KXT5_9MAGN